MHGPYGPPLDTSLLKAVGKLPHIPQYIGTLLAHVSQLNQEVLATSGRLSKQIIDETRDASDTIPDNSMSKNGEHEDDEYDTGIIEDGTLTEVSQEAETEHTPIITIPPRQPEQTIPIHQQKWSYEQGKPRYQCIILNCAEDNPVFSEEVHRPRQHIPYKNGARRDEPTNECARAVRHSMLQIQVR